MDRFAGVARQQKSLWAPLRVLLPGTRGGLRGRDRLEAFTGGPSPDELGSIAGLRIAFADDWVLAAAWTHYLVFDMVVGAWIARDAVRLRIPWPVRSLCLVLTFLLGPIGFLLHLVARAMKAQQVAVDD